MKTIVIESVSEMSAWVSSKKSDSHAIIGFIPTMGALHEGHISLINKAMESCDFIITSIFVNPTQFNNPDDLKLYPRTFERDKGMLATAGCDVLFFPSVEEVYPVLETTHWDFGLLSNSLEGSFRPGHFDGVLTVVKRLLEIVQPTKAFFGEKDFQQLSLIRKMVEHENLGIEIIGSRLVREEDGLAMSSRNVRLSPEDRKRATALSSALFSMKKEGKNKTPMELVQLGQEILRKEEGVQIEYLSIVDAGDFRPVDTWENSKSPIALLAAYVGGVRLIDNIFL